MDITVLHIVIILATVAFVLGGGLWAARSVRSAEGYSVGGRQAGAPMVAGSIAGTIVGGGATVGTAQLAYTAGLSAWWFTLSSGITFILMGLFYARRLRATGLETIPELLAKHYGPRAGELSSVVSSLGIFLSAMASCLPGIEIIAALFGVSPWTAAGILTLLVAAYTFFGGMKSAGVGGILKMAVIWLSLSVAGLSAFTVLISHPEITAALPATSFSLFGRGLDNALANLFSVIIGIICTQTYVQAIFSAKDPKTASLGCFLSALIVIPVGLPSVIIGMYMHVLEPDTMPILVLPTYLISHETTVIGGIALGGIILSLVSSIGGLSLGIGTMVSRDILSPLLSVSGDKARLTATRLTVLCVILLASGMAILNRGSQVLIWNYLSFALRGAGIFLPLSLSVFAPGRLSPSWAVLSMAVSTAAAVAAALLSSPVDPLFAGLAVSAVMILPGLMRKHS